MRVSVVHRLVATLSIATFVACASNSQPSLGSASGTVDLSAYPIPPLPAREAQILGGMSDADILGHLITVDSLEVATADSALRLSKSDDVLTYAKVVRAEHENALRQDRALAKQTSIVPITTFGGFRASHVAASLDSVGIASDLQIDRHYIMSQVELHQHVLAELELLQGAVKNQAIRDHMTAMVPALREHLARAHALAVEKGYEKKRA